MMGTAEVEIIPGWDCDHRFAVMQWDRHRDSGYLIEAFPSRQTAIDFARGFCAASGFKLCSAEILPFASGGDAA